MSPARTAALVGLVAALIQACPPPDVTQVQVLPDPRIIRLMQCQECVAGELTRVVAMGDSAVLDLRQLLLHGAPAPFVSRLDSALRHPTDNADHVPGNATVKLLLDDFHAVHRVRSSLALGLIGGDSARHALCAGKAQGFSRADVQRALDSALVKLAGTCP